MTRFFSMNDLLLIVLAGKKCSWCLCVRRERQQYKLAVCRSPYYGYWSGLSVGLFRILQLKRNDGTPIIACRDSG